MKRKLFSYILLSVISTLFFPQTVLGQQWYYFDGFVVDIVKELAVENQVVLISNLDSLSNKITLTDHSGYYRDSLYLSEGMQLQTAVSTFDCVGEEHVFIFHEMDTLNSHDFEICVNDMDCQAFFYFESNLQDSFMLHFTDISEGDIDSWLWDFGDGSSSSEQNPIHQFNSSGFFEVCLFVQNSNDSCFSEYCELIYVGENNCMADFFWENSPVNLLEVNFSDLSTGDISYWLWDFGDSTYSSEASPVHQYVQQGEYWVSLSVSDSMGFCYDETWQLISVFGDSVSCEALFNYTLDTLNNTPYVYYFEDVSEGNINQWFWEFGDGQISYEQNPQHIYQNGGSFEVCLTVSSSPASGNCISQVCDTVQSPNYFDFGGQVFIDGFTINIDSTDDANMAMAYLYRRVDNQWWLMDEREFWKYGYYWFTNKPEGEYLVRTGLLDGSVDYNNYAPSYYKESLNWQYANTFYLSDNEQFAININLKKLTPLQTGIGSLSGYLQPGVGCSYSIQMEEQLVHLFDTENQIIAYAYTDETGYFSFTGLAYGLYTVKAEFTGNSSTLFEASLNANNPNISDVELEINCNSFVGMEEQIVGNSIELITVYPQPATDFVNLRIISNADVSVVCYVYNQNGKVIYNEKMNLQKGEQENKIAVSSIPSGLYMLQIIFPERQQTMSQKIIINH